MILNSRSLMHPIIAITGSSGQVGSKLVEILRHEGFMVTLPKKATLLRDVMEANPTHIVNCIGAGMDRRKNQTDQEIWSANFEIPLELLRLARRLNSKFINIGSILEKVETWTSCYIESKRALTREIAFSKPLHHDAVSILTPIVFGLGIEHVLLSDILNAAASKRPITLESPNAIRDFIHVNDLGGVIVKLLGEHAFPSSSFEIGSGTGYKLSELCESVLQGLLIQTWESSPRNSRSSEYSVVADVNYSTDELEFQIDYDLVTWLKLRISQL